MEQRITSYLLCVKKHREDKKLVDFTIVFLADEKKSAKSTRYHDVTKEKLKRVKEILDDYTMYNREEKELCRVLSFVTIIMEVDRVIYDD